MSKIKEKEYFKTIKKIKFINPDGTLLWNIYINICDFDIRLVENYKEEKEMYKELWVSDYLRHCNFKIDILNAKYNITEEKIFKFINSNDEVLEIELKK